MSTTTPWPTGLTADHEQALRQRATMGRELDPADDVVGRDYTALLAEIDRLRGTVPVGTAPVTAPPGPDTRAAGLQEAQTIALARAYANLTLRKAEGAAASFTIASGLARRLALCGVSPETPRASRAADDYARGLDEGEHEGWVNAAHNAAEILRNMQRQPECVTGRAPVDVLTDAVAAIERALPHGFGVVLTVEECRHWGEAVGLVQEVFAQAKRATAHGMMDALYVLLQVERVLRVLGPETVARVARGGAR